MKSKVTKNPLLQFWKGYGIIFKLKLHMEECSNKPGERLYARALLSDLFGTAMLFYNALKIQYGDVSKWS